MKLEQENAKLKLFSDKQQATIEDLKCNTNIGSQTSLKQSKMISEEDVQSRSESVMLKSRDSFKTRSSLLRNEIKALDKEIAALNLNLTKDLHTQ